MVRSIARKKSPRRAKPERAKSAKSTAAKKRARRRPINLVIDPRFGGPWDNLSLEELARRQGVRKYKDLDDFLKGLPADIGQGEDLFEQLMQDRARRRAASRR